MIKTDVQLKQDIEDELHSDPKINAAQIGVTVDEGTVSLLGSVDTYAEKLAAEDATKRVGGVRAVAQDLTVKILAGRERGDPEIAATIQSALRWNVYVPEAVTAAVQRGWVTLEGEVTWNFQRDAAVRAIGHLAGVVGVSNSISLKPQALAPQVKEKIHAALKRQAVGDTNSIHVHTAGCRVTLTGQASSRQSVDAATNAAWALPGITEVVDQVKMALAL